MSVLSVNSITKRYPGVTALDGVSLAFAAGRVHGIIGENGAGKSTLMKIMSGVESQDSGEISVEGASVRFRSVHDAMAHGIVMIHQELNLVNDLSVAENIFLGHEPRKFGVIDFKAMNAKAQELLDRVSCKASPKQLLGDLPLAQKQLVEIAKALSHQSKVVIMDEPTAVLSDPETQALFRLIAQLKQEGVCIILISHILHELLENCDDIAVLRDGQFVGSVDAIEASEQQLAAMMVGRELSDMFPARVSAGTGNELFKVSGFQFFGCQSPVDLNVKAGEIVGIAGLVGSGRTELAEALVGLAQGSGSVEVEGVPVGRGLQAGMRAGLVYVSEDRKESGLHLDLPIEWNTSLAKGAGAILDKRAIHERAEDWRKRLNMKIADVRDPVSSLSGGNQQKVSLAKWLATDPKLLILDEPTRGVDVGAKGEIYSEMRKLADQGLGILMISSDLPEVIGMCDRVYVMRDFAMVGELSGEEISEESIMNLAAGVGV
ncbi:MAG: sugar ABC transporter ATP-binding protein [Armatimonadetes bacterium]|nr:sugar ABC transporter ATP-binding protein [Armatimonadota bacterium]